MTCLNPLALSMYVDGAIEGEALAALEGHLHGCAACRGRIGGLRAEQSALRAALVLEDDVPVPAFVPPPRDHAAAIAASLALFAGAAASAFWQGLFAAAPSGMRWLNPFSPGELIESGLGLATFLIREGSAMLTSTLNLAGTVLVTALFGWGILGIARRRAGTAALLSALVVLIALPTPGHAIEVRKSQNGIVTIPAGETINDTLIAAGQSVVVDGNVNGDLFAFGQTVTIRGSVSGNVITGGETATLEGLVGGSVLAAGRAIQLASQVGGNLYGFGRDIEIRQEGEVSGNAVTFADSTDIAGGVGIDVRSFGSRTQVSGHVEGDLEAYAGRVDLLPTAIVGGDLTTHTSTVDNVQIAEGAVIGGSIDKQAVERGPHRNRYATAGFYIGKVVALGAGFLAGLVLLWLFPALRAASLPGAIPTLQAAGLGLAAAVTLPIAALLVCFTIVGLPVGIATFVLGALGLYLAKPVVGQIIGKRLFRNRGSEPHFALTLLAGLAVVVVAGSVPFVGGIVNFAVTLVGFGTMILTIYARLSRTADG